MILKKKKFCGAKRLGEVVCGAKLIKTKNFYAIEGG